MHTLSSDLLLYALLWTLFGLLHSGMASQRFKKRWQIVLGGLAPAERLIYNGVSIVAVTGILSFGRTHLASDPIFQPTGIGNILVWGGQIGGFCVLLGALSTYDLSRLMGFRQILAAWRGEKLAEEVFHVAFLHRFVRHPMYAAALLLLWCRPWNDYILATNLCASLYFLVGLFWEERRLVDLYGPAYMAYQRRVPALVPWPWRK